MHKKEKKTAKRTSIRKQFAGIFIGLMAGTILLCWFLNSGFLQKYYISNKKAVLMRMYEELGEAVANDEIDTDEYQLSLQQQCSKYNLSLLVLNANSEVVADSGGGSEFLKQQLLQHLFALSGEKYEIMENGNNYIVARVSDSRAQMEYIESWGILTGGYFFIVRSALEGIRDSAKIANTFLASVGIFSAIISGIVIWIVSRRVTTPILQLADISERMCHLDFEARYSGNSKNEIGILGENINQLSDTLEHTISELKTANNELKKDIQKKEEIDQMRREFLSNVSHELKTPIALIQGYAEGLLEDVNSDPESRKFYCDVIVDEAAKMNNMVKKLLTLNQLESGNDVVSMERFDITALVHNYLQSADLLAKQNGISVHMDQTKEIYVWGDEFKIEEVLMNYFSNAVNHCEKEKVVEVKIEEMDGHARVSVFNTGMPIPEDSLPQATVLPTASPAACTEENDLPVLEDSVNLFVINEDHPADADFAPEEIADFDSVTVDARIVPALTALCDAAKADGVTFKFSGGYVSYAEQESLYNAEVERLIAAGSTKIMAREDAKSTVSAPGTSDLQSGLCVTVQDDPATFSTTDTYGWLQRNMAHYGFVFRYPAGKEDETGLKRNDLVLRYVGTEHAAAIRRLSFCLEEYLRYIGA